MNIAGLSRTLFKEPNMQIKLRSGLLLACTAFLAAPTLAQEEPRGDRPGFRGERGERGHVAEDAGPKAAAVDKLKAVNEAKHVAMAVTVRRRHVRRTSLEHRARFPPSTSDWWTTCCWWPTNNSPWSAFLADYEEGFQKAREEIQAKLRELRDANRPPEPSPKSKKRCGPWAPN